MKSFLITASIDVATRMSAELANNYGVSFSGVEDSHSEIIGALLVLNFAEECLVVSARFRCRTTCRRSERLREYPRRPQESTEFRSDKNVCSWRV